MDPDGNLPILAVWAVREIGSAVAEHYLGVPLSTKAIAKQLSKMAGKQFGKQGAENVTKEIPISRARYGEGAKHIEDAQRAGHPDVLTIARPGAPSNRKASLGGIPKAPGKQLDEYPPAMFKEGGAGASVRPISPRDNMATGACIGNACRGLANGERVRIKVTD